jgi:hypothetical protein
MHECSSYQAVALITSIQPMHLLPSNQIHHVTTTPLGVEIEYSELRVLALVIPLRVTGRPSAR